MVSTAAICTSLCFAMLSSNLIALDPQPSTPVICGFRAIGPETKPQNPEPSTPMSKPEAKYHWVLGDFGMRSSQCHGRHVANADALVVFSPACFLAMSLFFNKLEQIYEAKKA